MTSKPSPPLHRPLILDDVGSQLMTGIIAGVSATWALDATDSYLSTAEGDGSNGMKPFVLSHLAAVIAERGNDELFWIIAMEATTFDVPFDDLARFLPDILVDTTLGVMG